MRWLVAAVLGLAGCNQIFDLNETRPAPPADADFDTDSDGIADLDDNCRNVANPTQHDEDHDGIGDLCDNCPLVENNAQADAGDGDGIGDACDPHPTDTGDCLVLLDSFVDPQAFATHWQPFNQTGDTPTLTPMPELVRITTNPGFAGGFMAVDDSGQPVLGTFSVQMLASAIFPVANTEIAAVSAGRQGEPRLSGFLCGLIVGKQVAITIDGTGPITTMSASAVGSQLLMRLVAPTKAGGMLTCRADYGLAVGTGFTTATTLPAGVVGVVAQDAPQDVEAIALYSVVNAPSTCPAPGFR